MHPLLVILVLASPPAAPAPPTPPDLLSGPAVVAEPEPITLVRRDFEGRLEPLEEAADLAAIRRLDLDAERGAKVEAIVVDRQRHFDRIALANYPTVAEIGGLAQSLGRGRTADAADAEESRRRARFASLLRDLSREFAEFAKRGSTLDECAAILTPDELSLARRLVAERAAAEAEALAAANPDATPAELETRARLEEFGRRVRESIGRFAASATAELDRFRAELDLTPEQVETVRAAFGPIAVARLGRKEGDPEVRAEVTRAFLAIYRELDREQRRKLAVLRFREASEREAARDAARGADREAAPVQPPGPGAATH
jgi:hypothetical protein